MAQTVDTFLVLAGKERIIVKKPHALQRIFFSVGVVESGTGPYDVMISFDDPYFRSYYTLNGPRKYFAATGADIFQGNIWALNNSSISLLLAVTEILH